MIHIGHSRVGPGDLIHGSRTSIGPLDHELWVFSGQTQLFLFFQALAPTHLTFLNFFGLEVLKWPLSSSSCLCTGAWHVT